MKSIITIMVFNYTVKHSFLWGSNFDIWEIKKVVFFNVYNLLPKQKSMNLQQ